MRTIQTILDNYAAADQEQRLSMYLTHRELRRHFNRLEMETVRRLQFQSALKEEPRGLRRFFRCLMGAAGVGKGFNVSKEGPIC